ncbi:MAG: type IX secretion system protein PorQ [Flavobacteriales bacterium]|nr:type IX secretion system protein PorQ [Flavobacteriales bacterium]
MRKTHLTFLLLIFCSGAFAQLGGSYSFGFVNIDPTARTAALGSSLLADFGNDIGTAYHNPSTLNPKMNNMAALSYNNYLADINSGFAGYVKTIKNFGTMSGTMTYNDYGYFDKTDETGAIIGRFWANDYIFQVGYGNVWQQDDRFTYGINFKFLYSVYEKYVATAFAFDFAGAYHDTARLFDMAGIVRNLGYNVIPYQDIRVDLPLDLQFGISKKLKHNPLKFTAVAHNLQRFDISYVNTNARNKNIDLETGEVLNQKVSFGDKMMRHLNVGAELVFSDNFQVRGGYNHQRRKELAGETYKGSAGFSWGLGIAIKKFKLDYAMVTYFPGLNVNYITVSKNLSDFKRAKPENY